MKEYRFTDSFRVGRAPECQVIFEDPHVSRQHLTVAFANGQWWGQDMNSANGIWVDGQKVQTVAIGQALQMRLGAEGPYVQILVEAPAAMPSAQIPAQPVQGTQTQVIKSYTDRYLTDKDDGQPVGERTMMIRKAFTQVQKKQRFKYLWVVAALVLLLAGVGGFAWYRDQQYRKQAGLAQDLFYSMKSLDVDIANVEKLLGDAGGGQASEQIRKFRERRRQMEAQYNRYLDEIKSHDKQLTEEEKLIFRVTRIFGECELNAPPEFIDEIKKYIGYWKSSPRYKNAILRARENSYGPTIAREFLDRGLPPQFFYLAMQESNFDEYISGPQTYMGFAKGMWQFIPKTGMQYGLTMGPLVDQPRPDPADDRHNWRKATVAASKYIKDLYSTEAQASGLLVMACYNWGEGKVIPLVNTMPANPRERNFWTLLEKYRDKLPKETYDYVFYITSAAVIGENPKMFGFDFENPVSEALKR
ncbi:MAG: FHA domain-containing protein [Acidobacteria bacterium]|nr:FHA domain-containing protein [Acidobacteriota bacterium]